MCWCPTSTVKRAAPWSRPSLRGQPIPEILNLAGRLRASREELFEALQPEELSDAHRFVLSEIMAHIEELEARMRRFEQTLLAGLAPWEPQLVLLQTLPGVDRIGAAMLLVEIGTDMASFASAEKLASWVGICPGNNESAGKRKSGKIRKGNACLGKAPAVRVCPSCLT